MSYILRTPFKEQEVYVGQQWILAHKSLLLSKSCCVFERKNDILPKYKSPFFFYLVPVKDKHFWIRGFPSVPFFIPIVLFIHFYALYLLGLQNSL